MRISFDSGNVVIPERTSHTIILEKLVFYRVDPQTKTADLGAVRCQSSFWIAGSVPLTKLSEGNRHQSRLACPGVVCVIQVKICFIAGVIGLNLDYNLLLFSIRDGPEPQGVAVRPVHILGDGSASVAAGGLSVGKLHGIAILGCLLIQRNGQIVSRTFVHRPGSGQHGVHAIVGLKIIYHIGVRFFFRNVEQDRKLR